MDGILNIIENIKELWDSSPDARYWIVMGIAALIFFAEAVLPALRSRKRELQGEEKENERRQ